MIQKRAKVYQKQRDNLILLLSAFIPPPSGRGLGGGDIFKSPHPSPRQLLLHCSTFAHPWARPLKREGKIQEHKPNFQI